MFRGQEGTVFDWLCITKRKPEFMCLLGPGGPWSPSGPGSPKVTGRYINKSNPWSWYDFQTKTQIQTHSESELVRLGCGQLSCELRLAEFSTNIIN